MQLVTVENKRQMRAFVRVPQMLFGDHPCYVPPIWLDEAQAYTKNRRILSQRTQSEDAKMREGNGGASPRLANFAIFLLILAVFQTLSA